MAMSKYPLLTALMAPCPAEEFLSRHWPRHPFVTHGDPARLPPPFRDEALSSAAALAQRYRGSLRFTHGRASQQMIQIDRVIPATLQEMGLTLQFEDIVPYVAGAQEFVRGLELELGLSERSIELSAFASPREDGLQCHYDASDLISVQLQGTKRFRYAPVREIRNPYGVQYVPNARAFDELYPQAANGFPESREVAFETAEMKPGSVLFIPRGTWHHTEAGDQSLSVSIMINPPAALDCLLEQLRLLLLQDADWRAPLYGAAGTGKQHEAARAQSAALLAKLPAQVTRLSPDDLLQARAPLEQRLLQMTPGHRFQKAPDARVDLESVSPVSGLRVAVIRLGYPTEHVAARMEIHPAAVAVFRWLGERKSAFAAATLHKAFPAFPFSEIKNILAAGVKVQLLKLLPFAPLTDD